MDKKLPRYVRQFKDRHGKLRTYYRRRGAPQIALPNDINSVEFAAAYQFAKEGRVSDREHIGEPSTEGYVYFLRTTEEIKIGFSKDPTARVGSLKTGMARKIVSFAAIRGTIRDERRLHTVLARHRLAGEWFAIHPSITAIMMRWITFGRPIFDDPPRSSPVVENLRNGDIEQTNQLI